MRILTGFAVAALLLASSCATSSISVERSDITLQPGGWAHVHGQALHVEAVSRGPGMLAVSMLDAAGHDLGTSITSV